MAHINTNGIRIHFECEGPLEAPVLAFSNSLGTNLGMWDLQARALQDRFRILRYDTRGHGQSSVPDGPYSIDQLANDFLCLLDALQIRTTSFCGLSMGGMIGLWLANHAPDRFEKMIIANSAAKIGTADTWNQRISKVRNEGMSDVAREVVARWFSTEFRDKSADVVSTYRRMLESTDVIGYCNCCEAIRDMDQRADVASINLPVLIISGDLDPVTPPSEGDYLARNISDAKYKRLRAAHLSNIECAEEFTEALRLFLEDRNG
jgi:3-oxoadipate enol-lactonase